MDNLLPDFEKITLRVMIREIHLKKDQGLLSGRDSREEYIYFMEKYLQDEEYVQELYSRYSEMRRLMEEQAQRKTALILEILERLEKDKEIIQERLCGGNTFFGIAELRCGAGDAHGAGKAVTMIRLDNGEKIYYKPRSLKKEALYQKVYSRLCSRAGFSGFFPEFLDQGQYGWEQAVENRSCSEPEQVKRYFFRMGIHLFLAYVLGAGDLHQENLAAFGEYPVILDYETYPGWIPEGKSGTAQEQAKSFLGSSVLRTGLLPVLTWGRNGEGVVLGGISPDRAAVTPFKMPVVKGKGTSQIRIVYEQIPVKAGEQGPRLGGKMVQAEAYSDFLCQGFAFACGEFLANPKELMGLLEGFFQEPSRILLRHTQQYSMYLTASLHPDVYGGREERRRLLAVLHKEGEDSVSWRIRESEIESLLSMEIPYFEIPGDSVELRDGKGDVCNNFLPFTIRQGWMRRIQALDRKDLSRQIVLIRLSLSMQAAGSGGSLRLSTGDFLSLKDRKNPVDDGRLKKVIFRITQFMNENLIQAGEDVTWIGL